MGQRSQLYFRIPNIGKAYFDSVGIDNPNSDRYRDDVSKYVIEKERHDKWKELFGDEKNIIVGFHHQWLYGKSFVLVASMILNMLKVLNEKDNDWNNNPFKAESWELGSQNLPRTIDKSNPMEGVKYLQDFISNLFDFELGKYARAGIEGYSLLNGEDEGELITRFDFGDNNDGVLIVDLITSKYCFVNIGGDSTVEKLKRMTPVDASAYLKAYYPENENDCSEEELQYAKENNKPEKYVENLKINKKFMKRIKGFKTLSVEELIEIFPIMEGELNEANKNCNTAQKQIV